MLCVCFLAAGERGLAGGRGVVGAGRRGRKGQHRRGVVKQLRRVPEWRRGWGFFWGGGEYTGSNVGVLGLGGSRGLWGRRVPLSLCR